MRQYRKKPVVIDAILMPADGHGYSAELRQLIDTNGWVYDEKGITIETLEGDHLARYGDWIIRGIKGEAYPCKPDIFDATYDAVEDVSLYQCPPHEQRVAEELADLSVKRDNLDAFLDSEKARELSAVDRRALLMQSGIMAQYVAILQRRIDSFVTK